MNANLTPKLNLANKGSKNMISNLLKENLLRPKKRFLQTTIANNS